MVTKSQSKADKAKNLLTSLGKGKEPTVTKQSKPGKPKMVMTKEMESHFGRFVDAFALAKDVDARRDNEKAEVNKLGVDYWIEQLWTSKTRPPTTSMEAGGHSANFIVADKYTYNKPDLQKDETLQQAFIRKFTDLFSLTGMSDEKAAEAADNFVNGEMDLTPRPSIDLFYWLEGHYEGQGDNKVFVEATDEERTLGIKLVEMFQCRNPKQFVPLTDEEFGKVVEHKEFIGIKKGFLNRVCGYVESLEQLKAIFSVVKPIVWPGQVEFAKDLTPQEQTKEKLKVAENILGVSA